mmetsp:Transcript_26423/g.52736  ORF Transcript_26423/g.52736 Transcript_26423/m.52736 type:complete len:159 (+) Transcript_26423:175-651(+)|eukprot:CAMPEP_0182458514 /NCGR_PEP_ID=MMETSP1319-20130603/3842_1 /TAXON_ID=172717 /ORGANISM="Bolidomonas pacifica, Strain RCC208" /LENGTH=158 /DNA_ID=CAMNT_0024657217 /DNA_START=129 /DNA_END=605 /DNA_ORIENTATION=+
MSSTTLNIPLTDLNTAESVTFDDVVRSGKFIIDLWTTKCVRCPAALDKLNSMACTTHSEYTFCSIVLDALDPARDIIHEPKDPRWQNIRHFHTTVDNKEQMKAFYGFNQVPFYLVVVDGNVTHKGNKVDLQELLVKQQQNEVGEEKKEEREFVMDEDF